MWQSTTDPDERARAYSLLIRWANETDVREEVFVRAREAGDTAFLVRELWSRQFSRRSDAALAPLMIAVMADPGIPFAFGVGRDPLYENIRQSLLTNPPAFTTDTTRLPCVPELCRLLEREGERSSEPRLRDLALISRFASDPARWAAQIEARAAAGSVMVQPALSLVRGVGATWPAASKAPLPAPEADWRAWLEWMSGRDPRYPAPSLPRPEQRIRFDQSHSNAIRFYSAITRRDVIGEMKRRHESERDSARLVFGSMLMGLGELPADPVEVAARLRSSDENARELAKRQLYDVFRKAVLGDSAVAVELADRILRSVLESAPLWPSLEGTPVRPGMSMDHFPSGGTPLFIDRENLPASLREKFAARVTPITREEWQARDLRQAAVLLTLEPVKVTGSFASVGLMYSAFQSRTPEQAPQGYAGSFTFYLLRTESGWVIVSMDGWIT